MRSRIVVLVAFAACTRPNPDYCDETRSCPEGLVCDVATHVCVSVENEPPSVVSTTPMDGAAGVPPDTTIVITFSEPMDQSSVEAAWLSADLPGDQVSFSWNTTGDTLTVIPSQPLPIATGTGLDPSMLNAIGITYALTTQATDVAGNALATQVIAQFSTIRRFTHDVGNIDALTQSVVNDNTVIEPASGGVGDSHFADTYFRVFASFNLPDLPPGATLQQAELRAAQDRVTGVPYAKLGTLKAQHVTFSSFDVNTFSATPLATIGDFSTTPVLETKSINVTTNVIDDYVNAGTRSARSQYRLEFPIGTNNDGMIDTAFFERSSFTLRLIYDVE